MNRKSVQEQAKIIQLLCEGNSLRGTARLADCAYMTVLTLLSRVGRACEQYQQKHFVDLQCRRIQVDEIWSFVYSKDKNTPEERKGAGSVWTWTAICPETKLVPCWRVGARDAETAKEFISDLSGRMANRIQLTSDGFTNYREAVEGAFGSEVDYGMLVKIYDETRRGRYVRSNREAMSGKPDIDHISTSMVERQNLTMRMSIRRFARRTNAFSKKIENHANAVALHFMYYNFCRIHKTLRVTPAIAAGVSERVWGLEDVAMLLSQSGA